MTRTFIAAGLIAASLSGPVQAADKGLYEDVFAPNSSFIRVLAPQDTFATVNGTTVKDFDAGVSDYVNVLPGSIEVSLSGNATTVEAGAATHYTLIKLDDDSFEVVTDEITNNPSKSDVTLYNLTATEGVELYAPLADAVAIEAVGPMAGSSRSLKAPLTLDFELRADGKVLAEVPQIELIRRSGVSIVLTETDGTYTATATRNSYLK